MFCEKCGREIKEGNLFCVGCGTPAPKIPSAFPADNGDKSDDIPEYDNSQKRESIPHTEKDEYSGENVKKKGSALPVIIIVLLVLIAAGAGAFFFMHSNGYLDIKGGKTEKDISKEDSSDLKDSQDDKQAATDIEQVDSFDEEGEDDPEEDESSFKDEDKEESEADEEPEYTEDDAIHSYDIFVEDVTWNQAYTKCLDKGGYLVHFNTPEEYNEVLKKLDKDKYRSVSFFIGGKRESNSDKYYWINAEGNPFGKALNRSDLEEYWLEGEPSYYGDGEAELYMDMLYMKSEKSWYWNDIPNDICSISEQFKGKVGYICEYDDKSAGGNKTENSNSEFGIDSDTKEDYSKVTDFSDYSYYSSDDVKGFSFYYPQDLFNKVVKDTSSYNSSYGDNIERIEFTGSKGSDLLFTVMSREDDLNLKKGTEVVLEEEKKLLKDVSEIFPVKVDKEKGFFIITGKDEENDVLVYEMVRVEDKYVYEMRTSFSDFEDDDDKDWKSYYTECLYRSCGFSNSSKEPRSYSDYLKDKE